MSDKEDKLVSPCTYQGGKQRVAGEIWTSIAARQPIKEDVVIYDLCCGSGAVTIEGLNRGIKPEQIVMCDKSSWGAFWKSVGDGTFDIIKFKEYSQKVPRDKSKVQGYMKELSRTNADEDEVYKYILLQASSFGGKQIWKEGNVWKNTSFRNYWQPTETSNRKSPVNPMQPGIEEIEKRVERLVEKCKGLTCYNVDIWNMLDMIRDDVCDKIIYIDPPYAATTGYGFTFDYKEFIKELKKVTDVVIYVSEKEKLTEGAIQLAFSGKKGGISGVRKGKNEEWLNIY